MNPELPEVVDAVPDMFRHVPAATEPVTDTAPLAKSAWTSVRDAAEAVAPFAVGPGARTANTIAPTPPLPVSIDAGV